MTNSIYVYNSPQANTGHANNKSSPENDKITFVATFTLTRARKLYLSYSGIVLGSTLVAHSYFILGIPLIVISSVALGAINTGKKTSCSHCNKKKAPAQKKSLFSTTKTRVYNFVTPLYLLPLKIAIIPIKLVAYLFDLIARPFDIISRKLFQKGITMANESSLPWPLNNIKKIPCYAMGATMQLCSIPIKISGLPFKVIRYPMDYMINKLDTTPKAAV